MNLKFINCINRQQFDLIASQFFVSFKLFNHAMLSHASLHILKHFAGNSTKLLIKKEYMILFGN